jgi:hypothetical protein
MTAAVADITIAPLGPEHQAAAWRVAALDSSALPHGDLIGAEVDGSLVAVLGLERGEVVADPFTRTAELLQLLRVRAAQLVASGSRAAPS